jgi:hypothetical protein
VTNRSALQRSLLALILAAFALALPAAASAATYTVNTADSGAGSLRDALTQINASPDPSGDTIEIPAGTITLGSALPTLDNAATSLTITGAGARATAISGADAYRVFHVTDGTITITGVTITHGNVSDGGAGLLAEGGTTTVNDSAFLANADTGSQGGAIYVDGAAAEVTLNRDLLDGNSALNYGAGIDVDAGHATINTSTISHSTSQSDTAIDVDTANGLTVNASTIVENSATGGSGVVCCGTPDGGTFTNSIIARNHSGDTTTPANCTDATASGGHNITDDESCFGPSSGTDRVVSDVGLAAALANNGGPTDTFALLAGSPAIDSGDGTATACPSLDQRGVPRPIGPACDIGAYELAPPVATTGDAGTPSTSGVTVHGSATPYSPASYHVDYGTTTGYGSTTADSPLAAGNSAVPVSVDLGSLAPGTTYHYRLVVTNVDGTATGDDKTFTTASAPTVTTGQATNILQNSATLAGTVDAHGAATTFTFQYGTTTAYGTQTTSAAVPAGSGAVAVAANLKGLKAGQTYHYRLVATNPSGTTNGADATFKTKGRITPRKLSVKARPTHDRTLPYRFTFTGKLTLPKGISRSVGCRGRVSVQIKNGKKTISTRRAKLSKRCTYRQRVTFSVKSRLKSQGKLKVTVRFIGNAALKPKRAKQLYVRYG